MFKYKVVAIMSASELMRRGGNKREPDIVEGELPDEIIGMALQEFSEKGWRLHTILPLSTDARRGSTGYLAIFEHELEKWE